MNNFRTRPKSNYIHSASLQELYMLAENWKSDMDFFRDELKFLRNLIGKYMLLIIKKEKFSDVQHIVLDLDNLLNQSESLCQSIDNHLKDLSSGIENHDDWVQTNCRNEHDKLEEVFFAFLYETRKLKRDVFAVTEHVMETEKLKHLLTS